VAAPDDHRRPGQQITQVTGLKETRVTKVIPAENSWDIPSTTTVPPRLRWGDLLTSDHHWKSLSQRHQYYHEQADGQGPQDVAASSISGRPTAAASSPSPGY